MKFIVGNIRGNVTKFKNLIRCRMLYLMKGGLYNRFSFYVFYGNMTVRKVPPYSDKCYQYSNVTMLPCYPKIAMLPCYHVTLKKKEYIIMLNCNQPNCKKHKTCNLKNPMTPLTTEINYWLKQLKKAKQNLHIYNETVKDINQYHKYSTPVNVYGHIEYAPKKNSLGVFIRRPEQIYYGWGIHKLERKINEITDNIRTLRHYEYHIDEYGPDELSELIKEMEALI